MALGDWQGLDQLYRRFIHRWLRRDPTLDYEVEDIVQEVMTILARDLPRFKRQRFGSFRCWLRAVTLNRLPKPETP